MHWAQGAGGAGALLTGDTIFVTPGGDRITFVWSAPNRCRCRRLRWGVVDAVAPYAFDRLYYGWWDPALRSDAKRVLEVSAARYIEIMQGAVETG